MVQDLHGECWVPIRGYEGHFEISNFNRIKSLDRVFEVKGKKFNIKEKLKKMTISYGYHVVGLNINGEHKLYRVHRLLAEAFIPNIDNKPYINHKDGNRGNNSLDNLEWCTAYENQRHSFEVLGRKSGRLGKFNDKNQSKPIKCDTLDISFPSLNEAIRQLGVPNIHKVLNGHRNHTYGLVFRYL